MDKCPKCGSPEELGMIQDWSCGSIEEEDESINESETCLRRQLAAAQALNAEWEQKAANWMASPEAQQQLAGYRELSMGKLAAIEKAEALERQLAAANERAGRLEAEREELTIAFHALEPAAHDGRLIALYGLPSHESYKTFARILGGA